MHVSEGALSINRWTTVVTKFSSPSRKTSSVTYSSWSVAAFTSCIANTVTVSSEKVFLTFFKTNLKMAIQGLVSRFKPLSHPFKHVPFMLWHCSNSKQCPQGILQLLPYIPSVHANNLVFLHLKLIDYHTVLH